jgi:hypothetical protein
LNRLELELDRGDDAEAAAAAQRPELVGLVIVVGADVLAVGGHELDRGQAIDLKPVTAPEPAESAAERVAGDAEVSARSLRGPRGRARPRALSRPATARRRGRARDGARDRCARRASLRS